MPEHDPLPHGSSLAPRRPSRFRRLVFPWQLHCRDAYSLSSRLFRAITFLLNILLMRRSLVSFLRSVRSASSIRRISGEVWIWCRTCAFSSNMSLFERRFTSLLLNTPTGLPMASVPPRNSCWRLDHEENAKHVLSIRAAHCWPTSSAADARPSLVTSRDRSLETWACLWLGRHLFVNFAHLFLEDLLDFRIRF